MVVFEFEAKENSLEKFRYPFAVVKTIVVFGFRDIYLFNQVLLGKQCWRIFLNHNSLFYQILKSSLVVRLYVLLEG